MLPVLPNGSVKTSPIGIGCAYLTAGSFTRYDDRLIKSAFDEGARHYDVAPQYGMGTAESVLGKALAGKRNDVTIVTKFGIVRPTVRPAQLALRAALGPFRQHLRRRSGLRVAAERMLDFRPDRLACALEESLRHIKTDRVDALLLHMPGPSDIGSDLVEKLIRLRSSGKVLAIGLATTVADTDVILHDWPGIFDIVQYSWCALDHPLSAGVAPFRIIHRSLARSFAPTAEWLGRDHEACSRLSTAIDADLSDPTALSRSLLAAALAANAGGITLVASRSIERTRQNVRDGLDPRTIELGLRFISALAREKSCPGPRNF